MTVYDALEYFEMRLRDNHIKGKTKQKEAFEIAVEMIEWFLDECDEDD